jgi:hypothetical protein
VSDLVTGTTIHGRGVGTLQWVIGSKNRTCRFELDLAVGPQTGTQYGTVQGTVCGLLVIRQLGP